MEQMKDEVTTGAPAVEPSNAKVPVDPHNPPPPEILVVRAAQYLVDEIARCCALAHDAVRCDTGYARIQLVKALAARLEAYQARGLEALVHMVNKIAAGTRARAQQPAAQAGKEARDDKPPAG